MKPVPCIHCRKPLKQTYREGQGTVYTHEDGFDECPTTYASPDFTDYERQQRG